MNDWFKKKFDKIWSNGKSGSVFQKVSNASGIGLEIAHAIRDHDVKRECCPFYFSWKRKSRVSIVVMHGICFC